VTANSDNNSNRRYNNDDNNIKKFDTSKSVTSGYAATNFWCIFIARENPTEHLVSI